MTVTSSAGSPQTDPGHVAGTPKTISLPRLLAFAGGPLKPRGGQRVASTPARRSPPMPGSGRLWWKARRWKAC